MKLPVFKKSETPKKHRDIKTAFKNSFRTRAFRVGGYSVAATVIVLAIAVLLNVFAGALPASFTQRDTTSNQLYTVSDQTEKLVSGLEKDVTVYWVAQSGQEDSTLGLLLEQYTALSDRLTVEALDPDVYPTFLQQYDVTSVYNNSLFVMCGDVYRYVEYGEIYEYDYSNYYYDGTYDVSFAGESALTSAINYVVSDDLPKIYALSGHGESELSADFAAAVTQENVTTESISLLTLDAVPEDADAVFVYCPQTDISTEEYDMLLAYLQGGGNMLLVTDPPQSGALTNLEALMANYGVTANEGIVVEGSQNYYAWGTPYYLLPSIGSHEITSPLTENNYYVLLPIAQGLTVSGELPENITVTKLLTTSSDSYAKAAGYNLTTYEKEDGDTDGPFALGVAITDESTGSQIVWVSSGALLDDSTNTQVSGGNQDLFLNAIGWMCGREDSISIHAKSLDYSYLTIPAGTASLLTACIIVIIPLAYLAAGIRIWIRRKRR